MPLPTPNPQLPAVNPATDLKRGVLYIVGGGPSLKNFPLGLLRYAPSQVMVVNDGFLKLPWAWAVVSTDERWITKRLFDLAAWPGQTILVSDVRPDLKDLVWFKKHRSLGYSENPEELSVFGTSGYAALAVAAKLGFRDIHILGFDYSLGEQHWYSNKLPWVTGATDADYKIWAEGFNSLVEPFRKLGVKVVNYGLGSRLTAFPKVPLEDLENELHLHRGSSKQPT